MLATSGLYAMLFFVTTAATCAAARQPTKLTKTHCVSRHRSRSAQGKVSSSTSVVFVVTGACLTQPWRPPKGSPAEPRSGLSGAQERVAVLSDAMTNSGVSSSPRHRGSVQPSCFDAKMVMRGLSLPYMPPCSSAASILHLKIASACANSGQS